MAAARSEIGGIGCATVRTRNDVVGGRRERSATRQTKPTASAIAVDHEPLGSVELNPEATRLARHSPVVPRTEAAVLAAIRCRLATAAALQATQPSWGPRHAQAPTAAEIAVGEGDVTAYES